MGPPPIRPLKEELDEAAARAAWKHRHVFEAVTGDDGAYAFDGLPEGTFTLNAWKEGCQVTTSSGGSTQVRTGGVLDFGVVVLVPVVVRVVAKSGVAPDTLELNVTQHRDGGSNRGGVTWNADDLRQCVSPGRWAFWLSDREMDWNCETVKAAGIPESGAWVKTFACLLALRPQIDSMWSPKAACRQRRS